METDDVYTNWLMYSSSNCRPDAFNLSVPRHDIGHTVWEVLTKNYGEDIQPTTNNYWLTVIVDPGDIERPDSVRQTLEKERKPEQQKENLK